ncbi:hypothetical protein DFJ74DRAFT_120459 [Hyaloraphidium curvatum]|nr:hypothetical protein DFJ74DRAFT_120459 [Hyaloraphidium curvatum]
MEGLNVNNGYECRVVAIGASGDSTRWGEPESVEAWTYGPPDQPAISHVVPVRDFVSVHVVRPRQHAWDPPSGRTDVQIRIKSVDIDDGGPPISEAPEGDRPAAKPRATKIHYKGISTFVPAAARASPAPDVPQDFEATLSIGPGESVAELFENSDDFPLDLEKVEAEPPSDYKHKVYVIYEARALVENAYGRSPLSKAVTFQRAEYISAPIPWRARPEPTEEMLRRAEQLEQARREREEEERRQEAEFEAEMRLLGIETGADGAEDETDGRRVKKPRKDKSADAVNAAGVEPPPRKPRPPKEPVQLVPPEPEADWISPPPLQGDEYPNGLPNRWPYNIEYGRPIKVRWSTYRDAVFEGRALWYRRAKLLSEDRLSHELGWVLEVHSSGFPCEGDGMIFLNADTESAIMEAPHARRLTQEEVEPRKRDQSQSRQTLMSLIKHVAMEKYWFAVNAPDFLAQAPKEYHISPADLAEIRAGPWRRDNFKRNKGPVLIDGAQHDLIDFVYGGSGKSSVNEEPRRHARLGA